MGEVAGIPLGGRASALASLSLVISLVLSSAPALALVNGGGPGSPDGSMPGPDGTTVAGVPTLHPSVMGFTQNTGQVPDGDVRFYAASPSGGIALLDDGAVITLTEPPDPATGGREPLQSPAPRTSPSSTSPLEMPRTAILRFTFGGSNPSHPSGSDPSPGLSNYLLGSDPGGWVTGVQTFREVSYRDLWDGIDLVYRLVDGRLKYDLVVRPGADPGAIAFHPEGQEELELTTDGGLTISTALGGFREDPPVCFYQDERSEPIDGRFLVRYDGSYGFALGHHDASRTVVIDPLVNSTFLGGSNYDEGRAVAIDGEGNVLVAGYTRSLDLPNTTGAVQNNLTGGACAYVSKFGPDLRTLSFSTYLGGSGWDVGSDVGVDETGNVYLAGVTTSSDLPVTTGAFQTAMGGSSDAFIAKLDPSGSSLAFSTYLGGRGKEYASYLYSVRMHVEPSGAVYLAGSTDSDDLPTTAGAFQGERAGSEDAYVCKLNASGSSLDFCTFLGGSSDDHCWGLDVSDEGVAYVCGQTGSYDLPSTTGAYQEDHTGDHSDIFVGAVASDGGSLEYLTYVGNWSSDDARAIAVDGEGAAYVHGFTFGSLFPTTDGAYQSTATGGNSHPVVFKLDPEGSALEYSTYMGGTGTDTGYAIAIDVEGNAYLAGRATSGDFPTTDGCYQDIHKGSYDCYVSVLSADGSDLLMSTYVGMTFLDVANDVVFDGNASLYVVGFTSSDRFPTTSGAYQTTYGGGNGDTFALRFVLDIISPVADAGPDVVIDQHETVAFDGSRCNDNLEIANYSWTFQYGGEDVLLGGIGPIFTFHEAGVYAVNLTVRDLAGNLAWDTLVVTVRDVTDPFADAGDNVTIHQYQTVMFDGSGSWDNVGIVAFRWRFPYSGTDVNLLGMKPTFTFQEAGVYQVALNVSDAAGNWARDDVTVTVIDVTAPVADAGRDLHVDQNETVQFDGRGSRDNVGVAGWTWTFEDGRLNITLNGSTPTYVFEVPGVFTVLLTVKDAEGNEGTDTVVIEVRDVERPVARAGEDVTIGQDRTVVFNGSASSDNVGIRSFEWSFDYDDMTVRLEGPTPNFFFHTAGEYTVMLIVTDEEGNWASDFVAVTVIDSTRPIADAGHDVVADQHQLVALDGSGSWDNSWVARWRWVFSYRGTTLSLEGERPTFIFDDAGEYDVNLTVFDPFGNSDNDTMRVTINDITVPMAVAGDDVTVSQGTTLELNGTLSTDNVGVVRWTWSLTCDGADVTLEGEVQSFLFFTPGSYEVTLEVADASGNTATDELRVAVRDTTPPVAVGPSDTTLGVDKRARFDGSASSDNVGIVNWTWTIRFEGHSYTEELEGPDVSYIFEEPGRHRVTLTVTDAAGNSDSMTFTVTVEGGWSPWWIIIIIVGVFGLTAFYMYRRQRGITGTR